MKRNHYSRYIASYPNGCGGLCTTPDAEENLESMKHFIDESNQRAAERGFRPQQYLICHEAATAVYEDDGTFVSRTQHTLAVELYPLLSANT